MFKWFWTIFSLGAPDLGVGIPWALDSGFQSSGFLTPQAKEEETFWRSISVALDIALPDVRLEYYRPRQNW